jgi:eukaryotic-like serine/threonine-protein kinase
MEKLIGQVIDNYRIIEIIGRGGMGVVFKALDMNLDKVVALKMIDPFLAKDETFLKRFKTEARALAKLVNLNIVTVHALRETDHGLFMVMEYVSARTISEWIREKGRFSVNDTIAALKQILNAIGHAHKIGVIHRDIKPNNILLGEDGTVKVMDFGLAKVVQDHGALATMTKSAAGTLYYMSPEQIKGLHNVDTRSDIYSIGMTVYEMLAGRTPFNKSDSEFTIQKQIVEGEIPAPDHYNPAIPKDFIKFIMKALDREPSKRFKDIDEMISALNGIETPGTETDDKTKVIIKSEAIEKSKKQDKRKSYFSAAAIILILVAASVYFIFIREGSGTTTTDVINKENIDSFIPASLSVNTNPRGADVIINGEPVGKTPLSRDSLPANVYSISLSMAGFEQWTEPAYELKPGENTIKVDLKKLSIESEISTLVLNIVPSGSVFIGSKKILSDSEETARADIKPGRHTIKFVSPEFGSHETTVNLGSNQTKNLTCYFQQRVTIQSLNMNNDAFWGTVYINGVSTGKSTPADTLLGPGTYRITVRKSGFKAVEDDYVLKISPSFEFKSHPLVFHLKEDY